MTVNCNKLKSRTVRALRDKLDILLPIYLFSFVTFAFQFQLSAFLSAYANHFFVRLNETKINYDFILNKFNSSVRFPSPLPQIIACKLAIIRFARKIFVVHFVSVYL